MSENGYSFQHAFSQHASRETRLIYQHGGGKLPGAEKGKGGRKAEKMTPENALKHISDRLEKLKDNPALMKEIAEDLQGFFKDGKLTGREPRYIVYSLYEKLTRNVTDVAELSMIRESLKALASGELFHKLLVSEREGDGKPISPKAYKDVMRRKKGGKGKKGKGPAKSKKKPERGSDGRKSPVKKAPDKFRKGPAKSKKKPERGSDERKRTYNKALDRFGRRVRDAVKPKSGKDQTPKREGRNTDRKVSPAPKLETQAGRTDRLADNAKTMEKYLNDNFKGKFRVNITQNEDEEFPRFSAWDDSRNEVNGILKNKDTRNMTPFHFEKLAEWIGNLIKVKRETKEAELKQARKAQMATPKPKPVLPKEKEEMKAKYDMWARTVQDYLNVHFKGNCTISVKKEEAIIEGNKGYRPVFTVNPDPLKKESFFKVREFIFNVIDAEGNWENALITDTLDQFELESFGQLIGKSLKLKKVTDDLKDLKPDVITPGYAMTQFKEKCHTYLGIPKNETLKMFLKISDDIGMQFYATAFRFTVDPVRWERAGRIAKQLGLNFREGGAKQRMDQIMSSLYLAKYPQSEAIIAAMNRALKDNNKLNFDFSFSKRHTLDIEKDRSVILMIARESKGNLSDEDVVKAWKKIRDRQEQHIEDSPELDKTGENPKPKPIDILIITELPDKKKNAHDHDDLTNPEKSARTLFGPALNRNASQKGKGSMIHPTIWIKPGKLQEVMDEKYKNIAKEYRKGGKRENYHLFVYFLTHGDPRGVGSALGTMEEIRKLIDTEKVSLCFSSCYGGKHLLNTAEKSASVVSGVFTPVGDTMYMVGEFRLEKTITEAYEYAQRKGPDGKTRKYMHGDLNSDGNVTLSELQIWIDQNFLFFDPVSFDKHGKQVTAIETEKPDIA